MKEQKYIVFLYGDSRMGSGPDIRFCDEKDLPSLGLYANYISVYPVDEKLTDDEKRKLGMKFIDDK